MNWVETFKQMKAGLSLEKAVREEIEQALAKYPFFAMARMMVAKVATKEGDHRAQGLRFLASLYAPHRQYYAFFMGDRVRPIVSPPPRMGGQEVQTPREPSSKQEGTPSSSDEPGPADPMPFAPEYLPKLQGKLKAKIYLYRGLSERLRQAIRLPPLVAEPPQESLESVAPPPGDIPASQTLGETRPSEPLSPPLRPEEMPQFSPSKETQDPSVDLPTLPLPLPTETSESPPPAKLSPLLLTLQFELPEKPPQPPFPDKEPPPEVSPIPPSAPEALTAPGESALSSSAASESVVSEAQTPSPSEAAESTPPKAGLVEPISAFTKPYVPLENPDAPVAPSAASGSVVSEAQTPSPSEAAESTPPETGLVEPISAFTKPYVPLENPDAPVAPSAASGSVVSESQTPSPSEAAESTPPETGLVEPISAFTKPYVPLENPDAPVAPSAASGSVVSEAQTPSPSEAAESTPPKAGLVEPISAFTKPYVPLENPDAPVAPSKARSTHEESGGEPTSSIAPELFQSEHPIRLILLPEFDPERSVHLSVPEPAPLEEPPPSPSSEVSQPISPPAESLSAEPSALSASKSLSPAWQSFLSEIEKPLAQVAQETFPHAPHTLERLRQAFIRYLLEARKERRLPQEPPPPSTAIEEVLRLLETFQPKGPEAVSAPPLIGVPESEPPVSPPPIYTETMARLCWSQGDLPLAIEIYEKLKAKFPEKASYYQAQIERIQRGERP
jgi:hypothetical protein